LHDPMSILISVMRTFFPKNDLQIETFRRLLHRETTLLPPD